MTSLQEWNEQFGGIDPFAQKQASKFDYEFDVAYPVQITRAEIVQSSKGDVQIKTSLRILKGDADDAPEEGRAIEYFTLPKQTSDLSKDFTLVSNLTKRRMADVVRLLSAGDAEQYALYGRVEVVKGKKTYYDFAGHEMTKAAFAARQAHIHDMATIFVDEAHEGIGKTIDALTETRLYLMKKENPRAKNYPYTNLYAQRPTNLPIFGNGDSDTPF